MTEDSNNTEVKKSRKDAKREARIEEKRRKLAEQRAAREAAAAASDAEVSVAASPDDGSSPAAGSAKADPAGQSDKHKASVAARQVTADSANRERRIRLTEDESRALRANVTNTTETLSNSAAPVDKRNTAADPGSRPVADTPVTSGKKGDEAYNERKTSVQEAGTDRGDAAGSADIERGVQESDAEIERRRTEEAAEAERKRAEKAAKDARRREKSAKRRAAVWAFIKRNLGKFWRKIKSSPAYAVACLFSLLILIGLVFGALELADYFDNKTDYMVSADGYTHAARFDSCAVLHGIDVSERNEGSFDWNKIKTSGVDYVIVRAGYRAADDGSLHEDKDFSKNVKGASKAGLMVGAYFYSQALTPEEGKEEAEFVLDMVRDYDITMPLVIDYEIYKDGRLDKKIQAGELYAASFYHDIVLGFTNTVEAAGYESAVYANRDMLTNYMQADLIDDMATIWLARYDIVANLDADYRFWQYTDEGKAAATDGNVDMDFWYIEPDKTYETRAVSINNAVSIGDCRISFQRSTTRLHNFRAEPKYAMTYEGKGMNEGRDYISSVVHNTRAGTGYIIVRGIGKYKDWILYPFKIEE